MEINNQRGETLGGGQPPVDLEAIWEGELTADEHMHWASNNDDLEHNFDKLHAYALKLETEVRHIRAENARIKGQAEGEAAWQVIEGLNGVSLLDIMLKAATEKGFGNRVSAFMLDTFAKAIRSHFAARALASKSNERAEAVGKLVEAAIDAEPECPDEMPVEMAEAMQTREYAAEALRIVVRLTKQGIKDRVRAALSSLEAQP